MRTDRLVLGLLAVAGFLSTACLAVPVGTHMVISDTGCTSDGAFCAESSYPYYWAPLNEIVMIPNQGDITKAHELCHAHQDYTVNSELDAEPDEELDMWYETGEARSFIAATGWHSVAGVWTVDLLPWKFLSSRTPLEDFAQSCASQLVGSQSGLTPMGAERAVWMEANLR